MSTEGGAHAVGIPLPPNPRRSIGALSVRSAIGRFGSRRFGNRYLRAFGTIRPSSVSSAIACFGSGTQCGWRSVLKRRFSV